MQALVVVESDFQNNAPCDACIPRGQAKVRCPPTSSESSTYRPPIISSCSPPTSFRTGLGDGAYPFGSAGLDMLLLGAFRYFVAAVGCFAFFLVLHRRSNLRLDGDDPSCGNSGSDYAEGTVASAASPSASRAWRDQGEKQAASGAGPGGGRNELEVRIHMKSGVQQSSVGRGSSPCCRTCFSDRWTRSGPGAFLPSTAARANHAVRFLFRCVVHRKKIARRCKMQHETSGTVCAVIYSEKRMLRQRVDLRCRLTCPRQPCV